MIQKSTRLLMLLVAIRVLAACGEEDLYFPPAPEHVVFQVPPDTSQIQLVPGGFVVVTEDFVTDAHNDGLAVQVWTINSCEQILEMMAL